MILLTKVLKGLAITSYALLWLKSIEAVNITKPKRGRKAGITVASPTKNTKENDELKELIEETEETDTQTEDNDNLAEDISIDIPTDKNEEEAS